MTTLTDFFDRYIRGGGAALVYDDGFRRWQYSYDWLREAAEAFAYRLREAGLRPGDRLAIWSENRPEWVAAFWGCMLHGVVVIPIDVRASGALARRFVTAGEPCGLLAGDDVRTGDLPLGVFVWRLRDIGRSARPAPPSERGPGLSAAIARPFQPGIGLIASKLHLPVVPVRLEGVERVLHRTWHWPRPGPVRVTFGTPLRLEGGDYAALAGQIEQAVRGMASTSKIGSSAVA
jgi:hypothetical protein